MLIKTILLPVVFTYALFCSAQNEWKELDLEKFKWREDSYESPKSDEGIRPFLNKDGSFTIPGLKSNYFFDIHGDYVGQTSREITAVVDSSIKIYPADLPAFIRKGNVIASIGHHKLFYSISGEVHTVDLEKVISYNHKGEEYEEGVGSDSRGVISITNEEIIFYQHYFRMSEQTHPGIKPVRGVPYSFMRIGRCNLKTAAITFEYVLVDQFEKHPELSVGDRPLKAVRLIGVKNNHVLFGFTYYTPTDLLVRTYDEMGAIKVPENMVGYFSIVAVDLKSFSEDELYVEQIKKPGEAFVYNLFPTKDGFSLSWSKKYDKTIFEAHADLIEVEENLSVSKTSILLPVEDLPLKSGVPVYLQKVKTLDGSTWYALNARFANSKKRQDIKEQDPVIILINREGEIQYRDNSILEWSILYDAIEESEESEKCLPCLLDLDKEAFKFLEDTPNNAELKALADKGNYGVTISTYFVRTGKAVNYVQVFTASKMNMRTGDLIRTKVYVRTGTFYL